MAGPHGGGRTCRPVDLARAAGVSAQQVRNDEASGVLPAVERTTGGHRRYGEDHLRALLTYRALARAHGAPVAREVMRAVHARDLAAALELVDVAHARLQQQRLSLRATRRAIESVAADRISVAGSEDDMLIGEVADALGVRTSTLRSWDAADLVRPARTSPRGYRAYSPHDVRDARVAQQLRLSNHRIDQVRDVLVALRTAGDTRALGAVIARREQTLTETARSMLHAAAALAAYLDHALCTS